MPKQVNSTPRVMTDYLRHTTDLLEQAKKYQPDIEDKSDSAKLHYEFNSVLLHAKKGLTDSLNKYKRLQTKLSLEDRLNVLETRVTFLEDKGVASQLNSLKDRVNELERTTKTMEDRYLGEFDEIIIKRIEELEQITKLVDERLDSVVKRLSKLELEAKTMKDEMFDIEDQEG